MPYTGSVPFSVRSNRRWALRGDYNAKTWPETGRNYLQHYSRLWLAINYSSEGISLDLRFGSNDISGPSCIRIRMCSITSCWSGMIRPYLITITYTNVPSNWFSNFYLHTLLSFTLHAGVHPRNSKRRRSHQTRQSSSIFPCIRKHILFRHWKLHSMVDRKFDLFHVPSIRSHSTLFLSRNAQVSKSFPFKHTEIILKYLHCMNCVDIC